MYVEKYYTHPENGGEHRKLVDSIHEIIHLSEYHTVQDFCHYAFIGMLVAAFTESAIVRERTIPVMQSLMRDEPGKLDFLNVSVALWHILSKANDAQNNPGQSFLDQLNVLDTIEEVDPFTK